MSNDYNDYVDIEIMDILWRIKELISSMATAATTEEVTMAFFIHQGEDQFYEGICVDDYE